ncbi:MAG TPA: hypothetical protein VKR58_12910, partial [Aquella sp.]|nr:hypothetical protein [Aquella sp.]
MNIIWTISDNDIRKVHDFIAQNTNPFVEYRISKNINRNKNKVDRNSILKNVIMCLLTSQQRSGPNSPIGIFLRKKPFPLTEQNISQQNDIENFIRITLQQNGLNRFINRIPNYFASNYNRLKNSNWEIVNDLTNKLDGNASKEIERAVADNVHDTFIGFGPKQSRNILQSLGLTKYEIPIDSRITDWLNDFGFPVRLSATSLQDKEYYHFISDGIQVLCHHAKIYPCVLDAAIFS